MKKSAKKPVAKAKKRKAIRVPLASGAERPSAIEGIVGAEASGAIGSSRGAENRCAIESSRGAGSMSAIDGTSGAEYRHARDIRNGAEPGRAIEVQSGADEERAIDEHHGAEVEDEIANHGGAGARGAIDKRRGAERRRAIENPLGADTPTAIGGSTGTGRDNGSGAQNGADPPRAIGPGRGAELRNGGDHRRGADGCIAIEAGSGADGSPEIARTLGAETVSAIYTGPGAEARGAFDRASGTRVGADSCNAIEACSGADSPPASEKVNGADVERANGDDDGAEGPTASDRPGGADPVAAGVIASIRHAPAESGEGLTESEASSEEGRRPRYRVKTREDFADESTFRLYKYAYLYRLFQKMRKAADQLALESMGDPILEQMPAHLQWLEELYAKGLTKTLRSHVLWPWLQQYPGLAGVHMAMVLALIADPRRFPHPGGRGTGVRSVWHYFGLHCDANGGFAWAGKGMQATWNKKGRTAFLQPSGIVDAIVKARTPVYREYMDAQKARLAAERGLVEKPATAPKDFVKKYRQAHVREPGKGPLFPFEVHKIASKIVAKRILGDVLIEWKRRLAATVAV